jgi:DinB superfamily
MSSQLDALIAEFRAVGEDARSLVERTGVARVAERPSKGGWSVAECLEHLNMTTRAFLPRWREAFCFARAQGVLSDGPYRTDFWGKLLAWALEPPPKLRMPTTPPFQPLKTPAPWDVLPAFLSCQDELITTLDAARGIALDRVKVSSPFQERMRYSIWSSFRINAAHHRRHLWQAHRAAETLR